MKLKKGFGNKSVISVVGIYQSFILLKTRWINHSIEVKNNFEEKKDVCLKDKKRLGGFECVKERENRKKLEGLSLCLSWSAI